MGLSGVTATAAAARAGAGTVSSVAMKQLCERASAGMVGGNGWCAKGDPKANGFVCRGVRSWSHGMPGCVMSEMSEATLEAASSL